MRSRPQDFGIVIMEDGTGLLMDLEVSADGIPGGGRISFDIDSIKQFTKFYTNINIKSSYVSVDSKKEQIIQFIQKLPKKTIYEENRCLNCLTKAEKKVMDEKTWRSEPSALKFWYEIIYNENKVIEKVLRERRPSKILEIGCGPGRVIRLIMDTYRSIDEDFDLIVGIEQNETIYRHAHKRFFKQDRTRVNIEMGMINGSGAEKILVPEYGLHYFDLAIAVSNMVGWQDQEKEWIKRVLPVTKSLFFTVYNKDRNEDRKLMYKAAGDTINESCDGQIVISMVEAFEKQPHKTKSYSKDEIENIRECNLFC